MRFLSMIRSGRSEGQPPQALMRAMEGFIAESLRDGSLIQTGALAPAAATVRVRSAGGKVSVVDGPYSEAKEWVGGYAILEAATLEAAIDATRKFMQIHAEHWPEWSGECEIRKIDFLAP